MHLASILPFFSIISAVLAVPVEVEDVHLEKRGSITFEGCTAGEQKLLNIYLKDMVKLATAGAKASEMAPGFETAVYKAWWGAQKDLPAKYLDNRSLNNERLNARFDKLQGFMKNPRKDVIFNCNKSLGCTGTSPASTDRNAARIYLCANSFWYMPMRSLSNIAPPSRKCTEIDLYRGQAAVLLHELTHALFLTNDEEQPGKSKGSGYGHANALELAKWNIAAARENADSYAMFATAAYFGGVQNWETNPGQICSSIRR